jgi:hypothetical protein
MKKVLEKILFVVAIEAVHFIVMTGMLCGFGFFTRAGGTTGVTFKQLLWDGGVAFWFDGFGPVLLLCLVVAAVWTIWDFFADKEALEKPRKNQDQEGAAQANAHIKGLLPGLNAQARVDVEKDFAMREYSNSEFEKMLDRRRQTLDAERRALEMEQHELHDEKEKVSTWKYELDSLRGKTEIIRKRKKFMKQRIRWAEEALAENPPNVGLALRHLKKAEKE